MAEHDPALVEQAARAIACGWCHATNHEQCREWNKPTHVHSMRLYDARAVLDAVAPAIREAALLQAARHFEYEMAPAWGGDSTWISTGSRVADLVASILRDMAAQQRLTEED